MTEIIIFFVVVAGVIVKMVINSQQSSAGKTKTDAKHNQNSFRQEAKMSKPNNVKQEAGSSKPNIPKQGKRVAAPNKPQPGHKPSKPNVPKKEQGSLEKRFAAFKKAKLVSGRTAAEAFAELDETDILTAAKENTREVELENDKDALVSESFMDSVYDLIVKGPDDTLVFQRDFVAEGMEMLNHITVPDTSYGK